MLRARITPPADVELAEDGSVVFTWREPGDLGLFALARLVVRKDGGCVVKPGPHPGLTVALRCLAEICQAPA
jgi:hypothetical protein